MRRTDEQFINEVYMRCDKYKKKKKQRNTVLTFLVPILILGSFILSAMLQASSADKSEAPFNTVTDAPSANESTTYPPGTVMITVEIESENRVYTVEGTDAVDFIKDNVWSLNSASQNASSISDEFSDEIDDSKRSDLGEKICTFSFRTSNNGIKEYSYSVYENILYDEITETVFNLSEEQIAQLKSLLNVK